MVDYEELLIDEEFLSKEDRELSSYRSFVEKTAKKIPNTWDIQSLNKHDGVETNLYFDIEDERVQEFFKYYCWKRLKRDHVGVITVRTEQLHIRGFLNQSAQRNPSSNWRDGYHQSWEDFTSELHERIREKMIAGNSEQSKLEIKTAKGYAASVLRFLAEMTSLYRQFSWVFAEDISLLLPGALATYFTPEERLQLRDEFADLQYRQKTTMIPYDELLDIMLAEKRCNASRHILGRACIVIALHAGLRISEIRRLDADCLTPISKEEINDAIIFRENARIDIGGVTPDWSNFYWLHYDSAKDKRSGTKWAKGTPIMVSQTVHDAVVEVINATKELRKASNNKRLFLVKGRSGITSASVGSLYRYKNNFVKEFELPHFKFHQCRATFATILYDMDVPMEMIQKYLNHISSDMTSGYIAGNLERDIRTMRLVASRKIHGLSSANNELKAFNEQFLSAVDSEEWEYLSMTSQVSVFRHLQKRNNLSIWYGDHGFCIMKSGKTCPMDLTKISPCYQQQCEHYSPDEEALPMFAQMLNERQGIQKDYFKACLEYDEPGVAESKIGQFGHETQSLENLIADLAKGKL